MLLPREAIMDFNQRPFTVVWETTRACDLACLHCRAEANPQRSGDELTFEEKTELAQLKSYLLLTNQEGEYDLAS